MNAEEYATAATAMTRLASEAAELLIKENCELHRKLENARAWEAKVDQLICQIVTDYTGTSYTGASGHAIDHLLHLRYKIMGNAPNKLFVKESDSK